MIAINYRDARPIYLQLKETLQKMILSGAMPEGEKLPSVRDLSAQLQVNPNTIQRAYRELESEGYIVSIPGKGSFAGALPQVVDEHRADLIRRFRSLSAELQQLGVTRDEQIDILHKEELSHD